MREAAVDENSKPVVRFVSVELCHRLACLRLQAAAITTCELPA